MRARSSSKMPACHDSDLVVLTVVRRMANRLFLGTTVPYVLAHVPCAVAVVVM
ncbi:MAG: hypothetical protein ACYCW6_22410 [Candidatus Xenobia bacterium]